jgi:peptide/nickel transport system permease protein
MTAYILRRCGGAVVVLLVVSALVFIATNLLPGNPSNAILGRDATPARVTELTRELGLDKPLIERYGAWLGNAAQGDFGRSVTQGGGAFGEFGHGTKVRTLVAPALRNTAILASVSLSLVILTSLLLGTFSALRQSRPEDNLAQVVTLVFLALPDFVLGAILIILFAFVWPVLPAVTLTPSVSGLVLPVATLVLGLLGVTARLIRVGVIDVLSSNYVTSARLRGVPERRLLRSHVLPNALGPTLQVFAMAAGDFVGAVVVVEYLFGYPGIGTGFVEAVSGRDYLVVQAYALIFAAVYILANLIAGTLTVAATPRLRDLDSEAIVRFPGSEAERLR